MMTLQSSGSPSISGQSVTFTVTVKASAAGSGTPTGTVTLKSGGTVLGSGPLSEGQFSASSTALPAGADTVSAVYSGDGHFQPHTVSMTQQVTDFQISATALSPASVAAGASATSTVTISPVNGFDVTGVTVACSVAPSAAQPATCSLVSTGAGAYTLTVNTVGPSAALQPARRLTSSVGWMAGARPDRSGDAAGHGRHGQTEPQEDAGRLPGPPGA